ncbi:MAG: hypothetical protein HKN42_03065 [Granulosicoccus sp.]|nr:hypothetical protein [Granulosicoccus sp.]
MSCSNTNELPPHQLIAVIGCDGSGKSTVSRWLVQELAKAHDTRFIYFGTGDGPGGVPIRVLNWLKKKSRYGNPAVANSTARAIVDACADGENTAKVAMRAQHDAASPGQNSRRKAGAEKAPDLLRLIWAATVYAERRRKMRSLDKDLAAGRVVVSDRYPQAEIPGIHDGPRLGYLLEKKGRGLLKRIAEMEQSAYLKLVQRKPDLLLLLDVPVTVALERRPEETLEELENRARIARALTFQNAHRIVLDSSEPLSVIKKKALDAVYAQSPDDPQRESCSVQATRQPSPGVAVVE